MRTLITWGWNCLEVPACLPDPRAAKRDRIRCIANSYFAPRRFPGFFAAGFFFAGFFAAGFFFAAGLFLARFFPLGARWALPGLPGFPAAPLPPDFLAPPA